MAKIVKFKDETDEFLIEKGVPMSKNGRSFKYPFGKMEVGESFSLGNDSIAAARCRSAASIYGRNHNKKYSVLKTNDETYRCWRTK